MSVIGSERKDALRELRGILGRLAPLSRDAARQEAAAMVAQLTPNERDVLRRWVSAGAMALGLERRPK